MKSCIERTFQDMDEYVHQAFDGALNEITVDIEPTALIGVEIEFADNNGRNILVPFSQPDELSAEKVFFVISDYIR